MSVFVLDSQGKALMPCTEKRARLLLDRGRARVHRLVPMVLRLIERHVEDCELQSLRLKIDPGSETTGLALVRDVESADVLTGQTKSGVAILSWMELVHRGRQISEALTNGVSLVIQGISHRHCRVVQRSDGYGYFFNRTNYTDRDQVMPKVADASHPALYLQGMSAGISRAFR